MHVSDDERWEAEPGGFFFDRGGCCRMGKMAVLVDGGFYLKRARSLKGEATPRDRAAELVSYLVSTQYVLDGYARRIRKALGVEQ